MNESAYPIGLEHWEQLRDWLIDSYRMPEAPGRVVLEETKHNRVVLLLDVPPPAPPGRLQKMLIQLLDVPDDEWLLIGTAVCEAHEIDPAHALQVNSQLVLGALAVEDGLCWYRYSLWLRTLTPPFSEFLSALILMCKVGDSLEHDLTGQDRW
jgi:hypothetical protein